MNDLIYLPVSLGEAIDKLSILEIKLEKIKDNRKIDVEKEYNILYSKLEIPVNTYKNLYNAMKKINLVIWDQMDLLRDGELNDIEYSNLCRKCIETNDIRFRIKNKINLISNSTLKEKKSYKINRIVIILESDPKFFDLFIQVIERLSYLYDEIIINSSKDISKIKERFNYDNTIFYNQSIINISFKEKFIFNNTNYTLQDILHKVNLY
jgi:hypothetical protein